jgi:hypothetical protein
MELVLVKTVGAGQIGNGKAGGQGRTLSSCWCGVGWICDVIIKDWVETIPEWPYGAAGTRDCAYERRSKKMCFGPAYSSDNAGDGPGGEAFDLDIWGIDTTTIVDGIWDIDTEPSLGWGGLEDIKEDDRDEEATSLITEMLWDPSVVLEILNSHDWVRAIEIATSLWDTKTAYQQLQLLDDAITDATEAGELEGTTVHCDDCEVMRWVNAGTHLPDPYFCPCCLSCKKEVSKYGTREKPSALGRTFLFKIKKIKVTLQTRDDILQAMCYNLEVTDQGELTEEDDSSSSRSSQALSVSDDWSEYKEGLDQEDLWIESQEDLRNTAAAGNLPIKQPWSGTEFKEVTLYQNANITSAGADSDIGHDQEDSVNDDPDKEDVLLTLEAEGKLVVRQPLTVIAIEEQSFDVADIKLVKVTELDELDIDWWVQQDRYKAKRRRNKNWSRRSRKRVLYFIPFQSRKARTREEKRGKTAAVGLVLTESRRRTKSQVRGRKKKKASAGGEPDHKGDDPKKQQEINRHVFSCLIRHVLSCGEIVMWGVAAALSCCLVRGQLV